MNLTLLIVLGLYFLSFILGTFTHYLLKISKHVFLYSSKKFKINTIVFVIFRLGLSIFTIYYVISNGVAKEFLLQNQSFNQMKFDTVIIYFTLFIFAFYLILYVGVFIYDYFSKTKKLAVNLIQFSKQEIQHFVNILSKDESYLEEKVNKEYMFSFFITFVSYLNLVIIPIGIGLFVIEKSTVMAGTASSVLMTALSMVFINFVVRKIQGKENIAFPESFVFLAWYMIIALFGSLYVGAFLILINLLSLSVKESQKLMIIANKEPLLQHFNHYLSLVTRNDSMNEQ